MRDATRPSAVAGAFYPGDPVALRATVTAMLAAVAVPASAPRPRALIAPHAGYVYSGPIAASAYARVRAPTWRRVLLLGPAHRHACCGLALPGVTALATPLGKIAVDLPGSDMLLALPGIGEDTAAHAQEHSLEVHLPFLQVCLPDATVLPLLVGDGDAALVAAAVEAVWDDGTLVIASTDLSHFEDYATATAMDRRSCAAIVAGRGEDLGWHDACGRTSVAGLLQVAGKRGYTVELLDYRNSGDTAGTQDRVVGYASFAIS